MKKLFVFLLCALAASSCAHDIIDLTGDIQGVVKDYNYGQFIANCQVSLSPSGKMTTTDNVGKYGFADIEPGEYVLVFSKAGYVEESIKVTVVTGEITEASIMLKSKSPFSLSEASLDFGDMETSKAIYVYNNTDSDCTYSVNNVPSWISLKPLHGTLPAGSNVTVIVTVDRDNVSYGNHAQILSFDYTGKGSGSAILSVEMEKVELGVPKVSCGSLAENIRENSFDISGSILATGGQMVTSYGHCWSLSPNPTIADNRTNNGSTVAKGAFKSTITGLATFTTYYVRAYAENAMGVSYSEEVSVTTQDVKSDKWDGSKATSFAGGTGTFADPYIIKTGGHLLHMMDYPDKYYVLANNINLDNINWKPFEFSGTLDGKGFIISNLFIKRNDDYQGLFSKLESSSSVVKNLTIKGVRIDAAGIDYIGAIAGRSSGSISNCKVIFLSDSYIRGTDYIGAVFGSGSVQNCEVKSQAAGTVITGNNNVGGITGSGSCDNCHVYADVVGNYCVGGIAGDGPECSMCSFTGKVTGRTSVGGIVGYGVWMTSCKSVADIFASERAGGIAGRAIKVKACYSDGTITPISSSASSFGGIIGHSDDTSGGAVYHSFSTVTCSISCHYKISFYDCCTVGALGTSHGSNNQSYCTDITTFMKDCYSDYASYWNYNNTWTWKGTINGKEVSVSCPRLAWEQ